MLSFQSGWLLPLGAALVLRLFGWRPPDRPFRWRVEGAIGLLFSFLAAWLLSRHAAPLHIQGLPFLSSDFGQYCQDVGHAAGVPGGTSQVRSVVVAEWLGPLAAWAGVRRALAMGAALSMVVGLFGFYTWGFAFGGLLGGLAAVVFAFGVDPFVLLSRHLTFYPEMVAVFLLASGLVALAAREPRRTGLFVPAAAAVALTPLVDTRGAAFVMAGLAALAWVGILGGSWPRRVGHGVVLVVAAGLSWQGAAMAFPSPSLTIDHTLRSVAVTTLPEGERTHGMDAWCPEDGRDFAWGKGDLDDLRSSAACVRGLVEMASTQGTARSVVPWVVWAWARAWFPLLGVALGLVAAGQWRRPWMLPVLAAGLAPWVSGWGVFAWMESDLRRAATVLPPMAMVLGAAFGVVAGEGERVGREARGGPGAERSDGWRVGLSVAALLFLMALHTPWLRTWWRPTAAWRPVQSNRGGEWLRVSPMQGAGAAECREAGKIEAAEASRGVVELWFGRGPE